MPNEFVPVVNGVPSIERDGGRPFRIGEIDEALKHVLDVIQVAIG